MDEERLNAVFAQSAAPARDAAYVMAVMQRAEEQRWRAEMKLSALRGAGLAAAAAGGLLLFGNWAASQPEAFLSALVTITGLLAAVLGARFLGRRVATG